MSDILGIAVCDECNARIRVLSKHKPLLGRAVRCPKCHTKFKLQVEEPSMTEQAVIQSEEQTKSVPKRRSQSEIRDEHVKHVMSAVRALHARLENINQEPKSSEEQIRIWCMDVLRTALGYDDSQLTTEMCALGNRVDIAIKEGDVIKLVIECKNIRKRLTKSVLDQVGTYAATLSAPWAVVTNGDIWKLYRVTPRVGQTPLMNPVFELALLDEDGISEQDSKNLYLISQRGMSTGDIEREYHQVASMSEARVHKALMSERVLNAIRLSLCESYKDEFGQRVTISNEDAEDATRQLVSPLDLA